MYKKLILIIFLSIAIKHVMLRNVENLQFQKVILNPAKPATL